MRVNAEVILYGDATPGSQLVVNGEKREVSPDGRFALHYHLPDGRFGLEVEATSPDGKETRAAVLRFERSTDRHGEVGDHPHDPRLPDPPSRD